MNSQPVVSVPLITYNHEPHIAQALESVLMQKTHFPIGFWLARIVRDKTREIVVGYQNRYPHLIRALLPERNQGPFRNVAAAL